MMTYRFFVTILDLCRWRQVLVFAVVVAVAAALCAPARAADINNPAIPITETLSVQPIVVCDSTGANCAPSSGLGSYETYTNAIFDQAGIGVAFAPPVYFNEPVGVDYLHPSVDTTGSTVFDTAHDLLRLPNQGQSTNPTTLNVYLTDNIVSTTAGIPNGNSTYGYGLIGGNGAIIATTPDASGKQAAVDTMAHELLHNLGLYHTDDPTAPTYSPLYDSPTNIMTTSGRTIPTDTCQVAPYSCATPGTAVDQLVPYQIAAIQNPLVLNQLPSVAVKVPGCSSVLCTSTLIFCSTLSTTCLTDTAYTGVTTGSGRLTAVKIRFLDPGVSATNVQLYAPDGSGELVPVDLAATTSSRLLDGHVEWDLVPENPLPVGDAFDVTFTYPAGPLAPAGPLSLIPLSDYTPPFSSEFDFTNGISSRAGFDGTGFKSTEGAQFGFDPTAPGVPSGPSLLPTDFSAISPLTGQPVGEDTDSSSSPPQVIANTLPPFEALDAIPEPADLLMLGTAIGGLAASRRRRPRDPKGG